MALEGMCADLGRTLFSSLVIINSVKIPTDGQNFHGGHPIISQQGLGLKYFNYLKMYVIQFFNPLTGDCGTRIALIS